jgi:hypothetical protein
MDNIILTQISMESLLIQIKGIVESAIKEDKIYQFDEKLISPAEACKIFEPAISLPTLNSWTKNGWLVSKRIGGRVFYSKKQILEAGKTFKRYKQNIFN